MAFRPPLLEEFMFNQKQASDSLVDHRGWPTSKARLVETIMLLTLTASLCRQVSAQSPLAVGNLSLQEAGAGLKTNLQVTLFVSPTSSDDNFPTFSETFNFTTNNAGQMLTIDAANNTNFVTLVSDLTNGELAFFGYYYWVGPTNAGFGSGDEEQIEDFFALPSGNNGIDFQGFQVDQVSLLIDTLDITYSGPAPYLPSGLTSVDFAGRVFVNGDPLLLSTNVAETAEAGDSIEFSAFVASSAPLACQWFLNGSNSIGSVSNYLVSGANSLQITNVQLSDSGAYTLVVSNNFGSLTSAPMVLNVVARVAQRPVPAVYLTSQAGSSWTVVYSDNIGRAAEWTPLAAATLTNSSQYYFDTAASLQTNRFYEAIQSSSPGVTSTLRLQIATVLTLTGIVGDTVLIDYIYPFGPTNAWKTVGTATLTNATQLYFDVTTIGLPQRIYRVTPE
jgi:hypothetical protein